MGLAGAVPVLGAVTLGLSRPWPEAYAYDGMTHLEEFYRAHRWEIAAIQGTALACALASVYALRRRLLGGPGGVGSGPRC